MTSNYVDTVATYQVIGCVFNSPNILDNTDTYNVTEADFVEPFHKIIFGSIYNLYLANSKVSLDAVIDYLSVRPKYKSIFDQNHGIEYIQQVSEIANVETFNYYYNRLKKMSLLRAYDSIGFDVSFLYDPTNILDTKKKQQQEEWLDNTGLVEIANIIDDKINSIKSEYVDDAIGCGYQAGDGIFELVGELEQHPEIGIPMFGALINTVTRGARLRKFYLRSAATGVGNI